MSPRRADDDSSVTYGADRRRGRRDVYAWWEYVIIGIVVLLILGGAVALVRLAVSSFTSEDSTPVASASAVVPSDCSESEIFDATTDSCVPRAVCEAGQVYDADTNTCALPAPDVTSATPTNGPRKGGTELTVTGRDFAEGAVVDVNGLPATNVTVVDATTITAVTPASDVTYPVDILVTNPDGQSDKLDNVFTYDAPEIKYITEVVPDTGSSQGGEAVVIKGRDFVPGAVVSFYGRPATDVEVLNSETIRAITPQAPVGKTSVNVRNPGEEARTLNDGFTYRNQAPRRVTAVRPARGPQSGGTQVVITGSGFASGAEVTFGGRAARKVSVTSSTRITAETPPGAIGRVAVAVRNPDLPAAILDRAFTYVEAPTIEGMTPAEIPETGKTKITITGTGFLPDATVTLDGAPARKVTVVSPTEITAVAPAGDPGPAILVVRNPGQPAATLRKATTYVAAEEPTPTPTPKPTALPACRPLPAQPAQSSTHQRHSRRAGNVELQVEPAPHHLEHAGFRARAGHDHLHLPGVELQRNRQRHGSSRVQLSLDTGSVGLGTRCAQESQP
jgi:IPT/TIG domain